MKKIKKVCPIPLPQGDGAPLIFEPVPAPFINSGWRKLLSVLEIIFSCLIVLFMAYWQLFVTAMSNFDTLYEHPIGAQAYLGLGMVVLIPILFLLALWKKSLPYVKYGFLGLGIFALVSILPMLFIAAVFPDEPIERSYPVESFMMVHVLVGFFMIPLLGLGCLWRYWCLRRYACSSYLAMLLLQHRSNPGATRRTLTLLLFYLSLYVILTLLAGS